MRLEAEAQPRKPLMEFFKRPKAKRPDMARLRAEMGEDLAGMPIRPRASTRRGAFCA